MTQRKFQAGSKVKVLKGKGSSKFHEGEILTVATDKADEGYVYVSRDGVLIGEVGGGGWMVSRFESFTGLDLTKPLETIGGRPFKLLTTEGRGQYPVVGYLDNDGRIAEYTLEGVCESGHPAMNLRNAKAQPKTYYQNVYKNLAGNLYAVNVQHATAKDAAHDASSDVVGRIKIVLTEGEFAE